MVRERSVTPSQIDNDTAGGFFENGQANSVPIGIDCSHYVEEEYKEGLARRQHIKNITGI